MVAAVATVLGGSDGALYLLADEEGLVEISVVAPHVHGHVDVDDVTLLQGPVVRHAVAYDLIDGGAHTLGEVVVVERRGVGIVGDGGFMHHAINLVARDPHAHGPATSVQHGAPDDTGGTHALQLLVRVHLNAAVRGLVLDLADGVSLSWCGERYGERC